MGSLRRRIGAPESQQRSGDHRADCRCAKEHRLQAKQAGLSSVFLFHREVMGAVAAWNAACGVGATLGVGEGLGVEVGVAVEVAVAVGVAVAVAVPVNVGVGVAVAVAVAVAVWRWSWFCTSNEPMSMRAFTTRSKPGPR